MDLKDIIRRESHIISDSQVIAYNFPEKAHLMKENEIRALSAGIQQSLQWWSNPNVSTIQTAYQEIERFQRKLSHIQMYMQKGNELEDCLFKHEALLNIAKNKVREYDKREYMEDVLLVSNIKNSKKTDSRNTTDEDLVSAGFYTCFVELRPCALVTQDTDIRNLAFDAADYYALKDPTLHWRMQQFPIKVYRFHRGKGRFQVEFDSRKV